ncbi:hypothetical protein D3C87_1766550 [compost metagenome]
MGGAWDAKGAAIGRFSVEVCDLADVDGQDAIATRDALFDLVLHPFALVSSRTNQNHRDARSMQLIVDPFLDGRIAPALDFLKIGFVDEAYFGVSCNHVTVAHVHRTVHVFVLEAEKYLSCHDDRP